MTTAEMRALEQSYRAAAKHYGGVAVLSKDLLMFLDLALEALARREREEEANLPKVSYPICEECDEEMQPFAAPGLLHGFYLEMKRPGAERKVSTPTLFDLEEIA